MIELKDLAFTYATGGFGLQVNDLSIAEGQRCCWIGPSGSGKTTLLHLVAGIFSPDSGLVKTCGVEMTPLSDAARRDFRVSMIGLVFQDFALLDYLSVLDNVLLPYRISRALRLDAEVRDRAQALAANIGLADMLDRRPYQLSQGERQRVAICRAIITNPRLVLADEPTANLDPANAARVVNALDRYCKEAGSTLVVVTHNRELLSQFDDTVDISQYCSATQPALTGGSVT